MKEYIADIIIPHHDREDMLRTCLKGVDGEKFNIIVSSGGSFAENCNTGAKKAVTENLIFVNDDTEPSNFILYEMCHNNADVVGIAQVIPSVSKIIYGLGLRTAGDDCVIPFSYDTEDFFLPSGFLFKISRKMWSNLGGFDQKFVNGWEDVDLFLRAIENRASFGLVTDPVKHHHGQSDGRKNNNDENKKYFENKWMTGRLQKNIDSNEKISENKGGYRWKRSFVRVSEQVRWQEITSKPPLVSAIVMTDRLQKETCVLSSLEKQDYVNMEIIHEHIGEKNERGFYKEKAIAKARGRYLLFCANDIVLSKNCVSSLMTILLKYPQYEWAFCQGKCAENDTNKDSIFFVPKDKRSIAWLQFFNDISGVVLLSSDKLLQCDESVNYIDNVDLWIGLSERGIDFGICNKRLYKNEGFGKGNDKSKLKLLDNLYHKYKIRVAGYIRDLEKKHEEILNSKSFRLGNLFFRSIKSPYKLLTFPYNLSKIVFKKNDKIGKL